MKKRGRLALAWVFAALLMAACGGGSGRGGTDVVVTGSGPSTTVVGGGELQFGFTVSNDGDNDAHDLKLVNALSGQLTLLRVACSPVSAGATCPSEVGPSMSLSKLPAGASLRFTVDARVASGVTGTVVDTFSATLSEDLDRSNNSLALTASVVAVSSNLVVQGSGPADTVAAGQEAVFTMTVRNDGPDAADDVRIVDTVGSNLVFASLSCSASAGASCPATSSPSMVLDTLPAGAELSFVVRSTVNNGTANGTVVNQLSVSAAGDTDRSDSSAIATATVRTPRSGVSVSALGAPTAPVPAGGTAVFVMQVANGGTDAATNVRITDSVSGNLSFRATQCSPSGGAACPSELSPSMTLDSLPVGGALMFTVNTVAASSADGAITNTMSVSADNDADRSDNSATATGTAFATAIGVATTAPAGPLAGGSRAEFTAVVTSTGPSPASGVALTIALGSGLGQGGTIACSASAGAACPASTGVVMTLPSMPAGSSLRLTIPVVVEAGYNGNATMTVSAVAAGDTRAADNSSAASVAVASADLGVSVAAASSQTAAGASAVFTATVANPGSSAASNVTIAHVLGGPAASGAQASISCRDQTSGASCWPASGGSSTTLATLPAGRVLSLTITVPLASTSRGAITSTLSLSAAGDPDTANNTATATTAAVDGRNGSYRVFTAAGATTEMAIDFDAGSYTMAGGAAQAFAASGADYVVSGARRLRVASDLIVGAHDFGGSTGVQAFIAARRFGTSLADAQGQYNLVQRSGSVTRAGSAAISSDGRLYLCVQASGVPVPVGGCPEAALGIYTLSVSGDQYTATPQGGSGAALSLRLVQSGGIRFFVVADGSLRLGLIDPPALPGGSLRGPDTQGRWQTLTLSQEAYASTDLDNASDSAQLLAVPSLESSSMRIGARRSDNSRLYVMQAGALALVFGVSADAASGLLQIAVP
ncbi:hypothetical protein CLD22_19510 [Rubrivivax gelatinosus]|nr:hypothetical protein [Rubrivivax gelatinosus]